MLVPRRAERAGNRAGLALTKVNPSDPETILALNPRLEPYDLPLTRLTAYELLDRVAASLRKKAD